MADGILNKWNREKHGISVGYDGNGGFN